MTIDTYYFRVFFFRRSMVLIDLLVCVVHSVLVKLALIRRVLKFNLEGVSSIFQFAIILNGPRFSNINDKQ